MATSSSNSIQTVVHSCSRCGRTRAPPLPPGSGRRFCPPFSLHVVTSRNRRRLEAALNAIPSRRLSRSPSSDMSRAIPPPHTASNRGGSGASAVGLGDKICSLCLYSNRYDQVSMASGEDFPLEGVGGESDPMRPTTSSSSTRTSTTSSSSLSGSPDLSSAIEAALALGDTFHLRLGGDLGSYNHDEVDPGRSPSLSEASPSPTLGTTTTTSYSSSFLYTPTPLRPSSSSSTTASSPPPPSFPSRSSFGPPPPSTFSSTPANRQSSPQFRELAEDLHQMRRETREHQQVARLTKEKCERLRRIQSRMRQRLVEMSSPVDRVTSDVERHDTNCCGDVKTEDDDESTSTRASTSAVATSVTTTRGTTTRGTTNRTRSTTRQTTRNTTESTRTSSLSSLMTSSSIATTRTTPAPLLPPARPSSRSAAAVSPTSPSATMSQKMLKMVTVLSPSSATLSKLPASVIPVRAQSTPCDATTPDAMSVDLDDKSESDQANAPVEFDDDNDVDRDVALEQREPKYALTPPCRNAILKRESSSPYTMAWSIQCHCQIVDPDEPDPQFKRSYFVAQWSRGIAVMDVEDAMMLFRLSAGYAKHNIVHFGAIKKWSFVPSLASSMAAKSSKPPPTAPALQSPLPSSSSASQSPRTSSSASTSSSRSTSVASAAMKSETTTIKTEPMLIQFDLGCRGDDAERFYSITPLYAINIEGSPRAPTISHSPSSNSIIIVEHVSLISHSGAWDDSTSVCTSGNLVGKWCVAGIPPLSTGNNAVKTDKSGTPSPSSSSSSQSPAPSASPSPTPSPSSSPPSPLPLLSSSFTIEDVLKYQHASKDLQWFGKAYDCTATVQVYATEMICTTTTQSPHKPGSPAAVLARGDTPALDEALAGGAVLVREIPAYNNGNGSGGTPSSVKRAPPPSSPHRQGGGKRQRLSPPSGIVAPGATTDSQQHPRRQPTTPHTSRRDPWSRRRLRTAVPRIQRWNDPSRRGLSVLSLFDGIGGARVALSRAGIPVTRYLAAEIDPHAERVLRQHYPDVIPVGDVKMLMPEFIRSLGRIDLVIGGSPCQDLSIAKPNRRGLRGPQSRLFYEFVRVLRLVERSNPAVVFVLENVRSMPEEDRRTISYELGVAPVRYRAEVVSPTFRDRYYWTNLAHLPCLKPNNTHVLSCYDCLEDEDATIVSPIYLSGVAKARCIMASVSLTYVRVKRKQHQRPQQRDQRQPQQQPWVRNLQRQSQQHEERERLQNQKQLNKQRPQQAQHRQRSLAPPSSRPSSSASILSPRAISTPRSPSSPASSSSPSPSSSSIKKENFVERPLTPLEEERLLGFPDHYTRVTEHGSDRRGGGVILRDEVRHRLLGNSFSIPVLSHIMGAVRPLFQWNDEGNDVPAGGRRRLSGGGSTGSSSNGGVDVARRRSYAVVGESPHGRGRGGGIGGRRNSGVGARAGGRGRGDLPRGSIGSPLPSPSSLSRHVDRPSAVSQLPFRIGSRTTFSSIRTTTTSTTSTTSTSGTHPAIPGLSDDDDDDDDVFEDEHDVLVWSQWRSARLDLWDNYNAPHEGGDDGGRLRLGAHHFDASTGRGGAADDRRIGEMAREWCSNCESLVCLDGCEKPPQSRRARRSGR